MNEERDNLLAALAQLRQQLDHIPSLDAATAARLHETLDDIERTLRGEAAPRAGAGFGDRLNDATRDFEASHPIVGNLGGIIDALARMGI